MGVALLRVAAVAMSACLLACANAQAGPRPDFDACFEQHAARFGLDANLLRSIAVVESGMRPHVDNNGALPRTGTRDIGLMQINTSWLPVLERYGIGLPELRDPCTSIEVGAWILSDLMRRHGNTWEALGAYNSACTRLKGKACLGTRSTYAWRVWRARQRQEPGLGHGNASGDSGSLMASKRASLRPTGLVAASSIVGDAMSEPSP